MSDYNMSCSNCGFTLVFDDYYLMWICPHCDNLKPVDTEWFIVPVGEIEESMSTHSPDDFTERKAVDEALAEDDNGVVNSDANIFRECSMCHKIAVLPSAWFPICPECEFKLNLE